MRNMFLFVLLALSGCMSVSTGNVAMSEDGQILNRINGTRSIPISNGLSAKQALDAVEQVILTPHYGHNDKLIDLWRLEDRSPDDKWIRVGLTTRKHYLSVCYRVENGELVPDVPNSSGLKQKGARIHKKVPLWINSFNSYITEQMYIISRGLNNTSMIRDPGSGTAPSELGTAPAK